jgi:hypothetical protein
MNSIAQSFSTYVGHTGKYYSRMFAPKSVRIAVLITVGLTALTMLITSIVVTHAGVAKWMLEDVLNESIIRADYSFLKEADAPELSDNQFHLQMPMMLESYISPDLYVSNGSPEAGNPKIDELLQQTTKESFFNLSEFEIADQAEWEAVAGDAAEFIENRPPQSGLK